MQKHCCLTYRSDCWKNASRLCSHEHSTCNKLEYTLFAFTGEKAGGCVQLRAVKALGVRGNSRGPQSAQHPAAPAGDESDGQDSALSLPAHCLEQVMGLEASLRASHAARHAPQRAAPCRSEQHPQKHQDVAGWGRCGRSRDPCNRRPSNRPCPTSNA
jgi:hypothetical protein